MSFDSQHESRISQRNEGTTGNGNHTAPLPPPQTVSHLCIGSAIVMKIVLPINSLCFLFCFFVFVCLFRHLLTLAAELQRRIQAMEMRCYRKLLRISYKDHVTNEEVRAKIQQASGPHKDHLTTVKRRTLEWYGHVSRS